MSRALVAVWLASFLAAAHAQDPAQDPTPEALKRDCTERLEAQPDYSNLADIEEKRQAAVDACRRAADASPDDAEAQRNHVEALLNAGRLAPAVDVLRPLATKGDAAASHMIFDAFISHERGRTQPPVIGRTGAEAALRAAAEARHPDAMYDLAVFLHRGGPLRRDPASALIWAERVADNAPDPDDIRGKLLFGELLTAPGQPQANRVRGLAMLEELVAAGRNPARVVLARALRAEGQGGLARARALLEEELAAKNSAAAAPLAAMLIAGEGGDRDVPRALSLLRDKRFSFNPEARRMLGMLHLEGRVVRREPHRALGLLEFPAYQDIDTLLRMADLLTVHTGVRLTNPRIFAYYLEEAAEVGEPGALVALIDLKFSRHDQLRDEAGGYRIAEAAADTSDHALVRVLERRASRMQVNEAERAHEGDQVRDRLEWLLKKDFGPAFTLHGKLLRRGGHLFPQDDAAATRALRRAAELGDVEGMVLLAAAHSQGLGTPRSAGEQMRWLREAAGRGSVEARRSLASQARFVTERRAAMREGITEQIALYNDRLGGVSIHNFIGAFSGMSTRDVRPRQIAEAIMEGYRAAPAGLEDTRMVGLMQRIPQPLRAEIETILKTEGFYKGDTEGYFGPEARAALGAWVDSRLGQDPEAERKAATPQPAALTRDVPGQPSVKDIPQVPPEVVGAYWDRIRAAFKSAKVQKDAREAFRMLIVLARGGNTHARNLLLKAWNEQPLVRKLVEPSEITLWGVDVLISKLAGMEKAQVEFAFNTMHIAKARQMQQWADGFMVAVRDDPRLSNEDELARLLRQMIFIGGACDAIAARLRTLKLASIDGNDGCGIDAREALLDAIKKLGTTGTEIKRRIAASNQILKEASGETSEASAEPQKGKNPPAKKKPPR